MAAIKKAMSAPPEAEEPGEDPKEEASETPDQENAEESQEGPESGDTDDQGGEDSEGGGNASPQEQQLYNAFVIAAETLIFSPPYRDMTMQKLKAGADNPPLIIGHTAAMIAMSIQGGAKKEGQDIPDDVMFQGGQEIVADLMELAAAMKIIPKANDPQMFKQAVMYGLKTFGDIEKMTGQITPQVRQQAAGALQSLKGGAGAPPAPPPPPAGQGAVAGAMGPQPGA